MGESSARQLRGGMQGCHFTGTAKRKPVGVASVELRFDNTYGKLGGAYNAYNELAVRRQVNRDGKSNFKWQVPCDIDFFGPGWSTFLRNY